MAYVQPPVTTMVPTGSLYTTDPLMETARVARIMRDMEEVRVKLAQNIRDTSFGKRFCLVCGAQLGTELLHIGPPAGPLT